MKTAVDSSVLLDVLGADPTFGRSSSKALRNAYDAGALVACEVVWAEVRASFTSDEEFIHALNPLGIRYEAISGEAATMAGRLWRMARAAAPRSRSRVIADFLIGAHALHHADALLTRDRGFFRGSFQGLRIVDPSGD